MTTRQFIEDLEFDLPSALLQQLTDLFSQMPDAPLAEASVSQVPEAQGVYQLFLNGELVYVGKTDADAGLSVRLQRHAKKIQSRLNLDHQQITFKAVRVYVFTAMDLESLLIKYYKDHGIPLSWNLSGFGSNDPGRNRDTSIIKENHFDKLYPIDLDLEVELEGLSPEMAASEVLGQLKEKLAYTVRFENNGGRSKAPHRDLSSTLVKLEGMKGTVRQILREVRRALGDEWQITTLPGYVIVYKEEKNYAEGEAIEP